MSDLEIIRRFLLKRLKRQNGKKPVRVRSQTPLLKESLLDSFGFLELVAFLEDKFSIQFRPQELSERNFATLSTVNKLVQAKKKRLPTP